MHNAAFETLGMDAEYKLFELKPDELEDFLQKLPNNNIRGFNVTVPYKEEMLKHLSWKSVEVEAIGAVNTVRVLKGNYLKGYNTDGRGFFTHLKSDLMFNPVNRNIAVLGAGGGAKAVCTTLAQKEVRQILIFDLDVDKACEFAEKLQKLFPKSIIKAVDDVKKLDIKKSNLLINATPVGLKEDDPCIVDPEELHTNILVYDLIYNPVETTLLRKAKSKGAKISNGLGMLFYQGTATLERFTDLKLSNDVRNAMWRSLFT